MTNTTFDEFVTSALPDLLALAHRLTADAREAEDLVQAALVRTKGRWSAVARRDDPFDYTRRVMVQTHISRWRRWSSHVAMGSVPAHACADQTRLTTDQDEVRRALLALPRRRRAVLVLRLYEDMSDAQIGDTVGCRPGLVKSQASRGLAALHELLEQPRPPIDIEVVAR